MTSYLASNKIINLILHPISIILHKLIAFKSNILNSKCSWKDYLLISKYIYYLFFNPP